MSPWNSIALVLDPINNPLHRLVSCIVSWSSWTLSRVSFVSAVELKIPGREGLFRRCLLIPYLRRSLDVNTCSEVETPSDLSGRLIGQRRNENYALRLCALPRCSHEEKSPGPLRRSLPARFEVNKADRTTELFWSKISEHGRLSKDTRFLSICTNRRAFLLAILTVSWFDGTGETRRKSICSFVCMENCMML